MGDISKKGHGIEIRGKARKDEAHGYYKKDMGMRGGAMYATGGRVGLRDRAFAKGGKVTKKAAGGPMKQGYNARLDESLGARHPGARGSLAGRRAMSKGMEKSMGHGAYSGASTMAKRGGKIAGKMHGGKVHKKKK